MLLGRTAEKRNVQELLDAARAGRSRAMVVVGDPGVGKTALLEYALDSAPDFLRLSTQGTESEAELPFAGVAEILRPTTGRISDLPPPQSAALAGALGLGPRIPADPFTTFLGTFSLLAVAAEQGPVLVVVDDAHWLDQSSQDAILFVARRLEAEGVAVLLAVRPEIPHAFADPTFSRLVIGGLAPRDAKRLLARPGVAIAPAVASRLVDAANGNPLALLELPKLLSPSELAGETELHDPIPIGPDLRQLFLRRLEGLSDGTLQALLVASASTSGDVAEIGQAVAALGLSGIALEPAEAAGIVTMDRELRFTHPLVRAAIYHDAPPRLRREVHRALAEVVAGYDASARRAWHLAAATIGADETVAEAVEAAADEARARGAHAVAASTFQRAAELSEAPGGRIGRLVAAATERVFAGQPGQALPLLEDARRHAPDASSRAQIDHLRGRVLMNTGPLQQAHEVLADAAHATESMAPEQAASMLSDASLACFISGQIDIGEEYSRRAMELTGGRDDAPGEINHILFAGVLVLAGKALEAEEHIERERQRIRSKRDGDEWQLLALSAIWLMWVEDLELARMVLDGATGEARRMGAVGLLPLSLAQRAELAWRRGHGTRARADATEAVRLAADTGQAVTLSYALATQTWVLAGLGREAECRASAEAALATADPVGAESTRCRTEAALGLLHLGAARYGEAAHHLANAHQLLHAQGVKEPTVVPCLGDLVESLLRTGQAARASAVLDQVESREGAATRTWTKAILARSRGMMASDGKFADHFERALEWHDRLPMRFDRARTLLAYGERLRRGGQRLAAREKLREALQLFQQVGAATWAAKTGSELRASGGTSAEGGASELGRLTPQELQIALAVAGGLTNREVAASLFLSPKTIEFHLGNVYSKLALRSRTELVRLVAARA